MKFDQQLDMKLGIEPTAITATINLKKQQTIHVTNGIKGGYS